MRSSTEWTEILLFHDYKHAQVNSFWHGKTFSFMTGTSPCMLWGGHFRLLSLPVWPDPSTTGIPPWPCDWVCGPWSLLLQTFFLHSWWVFVNCRHADVHVKTQSTPVISPYIGVPLNTWSKHMHLSEILYQINHHFLICQKFLVQSSFRCLNSLCTRKIAVWSVIHCMIKHLYLSELIPHQTHHHTLNY